MKLLWDLGAPPARVNAVRTVLAAWAGTRYGKGQRCKGVAVDCENFTCAVLSEVLGLHIPHKESLRTLCRRVHSGLVAPGDVVAARPDGEEEPTHMLLVGPEPNTLWHSIEKRGVCFTSPGGLLIMQHTVHSVWRPL